MNRLKKLWRAQIVGTFLVGLGVLIPIALTVTIINWLVGKIIAVIGPSTTFGDLLSAGGSVFVGNHHTAIAFGLGLLIAIVCIWILGILVKLVTRNRFDRAADRFFNHFPVVRSVYKAVAQVSGQLSNNTEGKFTGMSVCTVKFGANGGADFLALRSCEDVFVIAGERKVLVYIPTAPIPMSGGLILVSETSITMMPDLSVDKMFKVYFSLGTLASGTLPSIVEDPDDTKRQYTV